jgi:hypothetical protein
LSSALSQGSFAWVSFAWRALLDLLLGTRRIQLGTLQKSLARSKKSLEKEP